MSDLVTWLRAQLDEDEASLDDVHSDSCESRPDPDGASWVRQHGPCDCGWPAQLLAEVEAKRALLDAFDEPTTVDNVAEEEGLCRAVRIIATAYADRPGYLEEWRP